MNVKRSQNGFPACFAMIALAVAVPVSAMAQDKSRIPDPAIYQAMLNAARDSGWVAFRNWNG